MNKVTSLGAIRARLKRRGRTIVHAHGTFDLLHPGHIRHLEAAAKFGDLLVVTVTSDRFVNKGPGRPAFPAELRAEALAALECVDLVAITDASTAVPAIMVIKPDRYVKGADYEASADDALVAERKAVEFFGGTVCFTPAPVRFSSTTLINQHLPVFEPDIRDYLATIRKTYGVKAICDWIERVKDYRVLVVGDTIIDEYRYVLPMTKTPKENMIATRYQRTERFDGGVVAAANHITSFCKQVDVLTDRASAVLKQRFIDTSDVNMRKLFEIYTMDDAPLPASRRAEIDQTIVKTAGQYDLVVVTDFGHGLLDKSSIEALERSSNFLAVNAQSNSENFGYNLITKYFGANYVCIDAPEARLALSDRVSDMPTIMQALALKTDCATLVVTHGKNGCYVFDSKITHVPAFANHVVDTLGAGDAFFAITAPLVAVGMPLELAGFVGNVAGALKVEIVGHQRPVTKTNLLRAITGLLG